MKYYTSLVRIEFGGNGFEAESKHEYIQKVISNYKEEFNIELDESEILDIDHNEEIQNED